MQFICANQYYATCILSAGHWLLPFSWAGILTFGMFSSHPRHLLLLVLAYSAVKCLWSSLASAAAPPLDFDFDVLPPPPPDRIYIWTTQAILISNTQTHIYSGEKDECSALVTKNYKIRLLEHNIMIKLLVYLNSREKINNNNNNKNHKYSAMC